MSLNFKFFFIRVYFEPLAQFHGYELSSAFAIAATHFLNANSGHHSKDKMAFE